MDPVTSPEDIIDAWIGDNPPSDKDQILRYIKAAERKVRREITGLTARLEHPETEPDLRDTLVDVVVEMVTRVYRNPEGIRQMQETTGPFSGSVTYGGDQPGSLYLTDDNRKALEAPEQGIRFGSVRLRASRPLMGWPYA